jgi:histidyl-tRNA synthetase
MWRDVTDTNGRRLEALRLLCGSLDAVGVDYDLDTSARRGMSYYSGLGFEASNQALGAQKQIAGGGTYAEGVGWAIGVDRCLLLPSNERLPAERLRS